MTLQKPSNPPWTRPCEDPYLLACPLIALGPSPPGRAAKAVVASLLHTFPAVGRTSGERPEQEHFHGLSGAIFRALAQGWRPYVGEDDAKLCWRGRCRRTAFGGSTSGRERAGASATGWRKGRRMAADLGWAAQGHWSRDGRGEGHICLHMLGAGNLCCALACRTSHEHLRIFQVRHVVGPQPATPGWAADLAAGPAVWPAVMLTDTVTPDQRHFRAGLRAFRMSFSLEGQVVFLLSRVGPGPVTQGPRP